MDMEVLTHLIADFFPSMSEHMRANNVLVELISPPLFLQAFVGSLPTDTQVEGEVRGG